MAIVLVKIVSTDNGDTEYQTRSTCHTGRHTITADVFSTYLEECKTYSTYCDSTELYSYTYHVLEY